MTVVLGYLTCQTCTHIVLYIAVHYPPYRKAHRKAVESQKKHQQEIAQLEEELQEVQRAMNQFEGEGGSQEDDLQLMDSQVM